MERIGGWLGGLFYGVQALALGGGVAVTLLGMNTEAWFRWTMTPLIGLGLALVYGLALVGAARTAWEIFLGQERDPGTKTCACCGQELPAILACFHKQRGNRSGLQSRCRRCAFKAALGR